MSTSTPARMVVRTDDGSDWASEWNYDPAEVADWGSAKGRDLIGALIGDDDDYMTMNTEDGGWVAIPTRRVVSVRYEERP